MTHVKLNSQELQKVLQNDFGAKNGEFRANRTLFIEHQTVENFRFGQFFALYVGNVVELSLRGTND